MQSLSTYKILETVDLSQLGLLTSLDVALDLLGPLNSKTSLEDLSDILQRKSLDFRIAEDDKYPTKETDCRVKSKCAARSQPFHH